MADKTTREAKEKLVEQLMGELPHGSGINYDWDYKVRKNGNVCFTNRYYIINQDGYGIGSVGFTVIVSRNYDIFKLTFETGTHGMINRYAYGLKDYLEDCFHHFFVGRDITELTKAVA